MLVFNDLGFYLSHRFYSDVFLLQPVEDKVVSLGSLELRDHVASTVNGGEGEVTAFFNLTSDLSIDVVRSH